MTTPDAPKPGLKARFANALRPKASRQRLKKALPPQYTEEFIVKQNSISSNSGVTPLQAHNEKYRERNANVDTQRGERRDEPTEMLHSLGPRGSFDWDIVLPGEALGKKFPGERMISSLTPALWQKIASYLSLAEVASLAFASKPLLRFLGSAAWRDLSRPENHEERIKFLITLDIRYPKHLFCFPCARYHRRIQYGQERLKGPTVLNPLFDCPNAFSKAPRIRITPGRFFPYGFLQLAIRAWKYTPAHGVTAESLSRRWVQDEWSHVTRYHISNGRLYFRVVSTRAAAPALPMVAKRNLLYSREDYSPYFSVCAHWRDGELMNICKCALDHIPVPRSEAGPQAIGNKFKDTLTGSVPHAHTLVSLCSKCKPMRRCTECPTEFLVEIKLVEDRATKSFNRAIVVTRWSDLGDEKSPYAAEWAAINGDLAGYDSFQKIGHRSIAGTFEAYYTDDHIPGQRILSLNPKGKKLGEDGHDWY
ncbi:hypothetical protein BP5796_06419 [Coleophoma crateriformis]|uniref:F-box domain-containing protein n=1 Tax=Coleophoma crateriformis TaxID=565419 RepID=A0A3D8RNR8_9HELO|nr:hypothetical protein BP5796_06419 [Coleophoma crateriformis]